MLSPAERKGEIMNVQAVLSPVRRLFLTVSTTLQAFRPETFEVSIPERNGSERETFKARLLHISKPLPCTRKTGSDTVRILTFSRGHIHHPIRAVLRLERIVMRNNKPRVIPGTDIQDEEETQFSVLLQENEEGKFCVPAVIKRL